MDPLPELDQLAVIEGTPCVTLYLNTRLKEQTARERAKQFVRRRIERALRAGAGDSTRADLERVLAEAERRVETPQDGAPTAVAVFSCLARDVFRVVELAVPVEDQLVVGNAPALKQLAALSGDYERTLLVLVSAEDARIYELLLGRVAVSQDVEGDEINTKRAPRLSPGWTQLHYQRQVREQIERHLREVAARTTFLYDRDRPPRLVVGGAQPTIDRFLHELPQRLRTRVTDVIALSPEAPLTEVIHAAMSASRNEDLARETEGVQQAVDLALSDGPAALGLDEVLEATQQKRLMTVFLDPLFRRDGWRCEACGALALRDDGSRTCGYCAAKTSAVELGEALVRQAIVQGGEVDFVPRSEALERFDGVAAKLRW
jgi:peptide chain release factor subunit 1